MDMMEFLEEIIAWIGVILGLVLLVMYGRIYQFERQLKRDSKHPTTARFVPPGLFFLYPKSISECRETRGAYNSILLLFWPLAVVFWTLVIGGRALLNYIGQPT